MPRDEGDGPISRELRRCGFRRLKPFWVPEWYYNEVMDRALNWKEQVHQIRAEVRDEMYGSTEDLGYRDAD